MVYGNGSLKSRRHLFRSFFV